MVLTWTHHTLTHANTGALVVGVREETVLRIWNLGRVMLPYLGLDHSLQFTVINGTTFFFFQGYLIHKWLWSTFLPNPTVNHFDHSRNVKMWPRGHTCIHMPVFCFSFLKLTMTEEQAQPLHWLDSHLSRLFNPRWNLGEERGMNSSHKAGFLPPIHPQPYWLCSPAVNWAPYAKAGWPRPSWLW